MSGFDGIVGQEHALSILRHSLQTGRIASAYLFEGPSGVGKELAALALAKEALGAAAAARIDAGIHPDVRVFRPRDEGQGNIPVAFLREEILPFAQFAPFEASSAFVLFPEADRSFPSHQAAAANALLKTLEEPRKNVHFVLLAERPDRLLATIRSRCQRLRFAPLGRSSLRAILRAQGVADDRIAGAVALAGGRADRALLLAAEGAVQEHLERAIGLDEVLTSARPGDLLAAAEELSKLDDRQLALETLAGFYRDVVMVGSGLGEEAVGFVEALPVLRDAAARLSPAVAAERARMLLGVQEDLDRNANAQTAFDALLFRLRALNSTTAFRRAADG